MSIIAALAEMIPSPLMVFVVYFGKNSSGSELPQSLRFIILKLLILGSIPAILKCHSEVSFLLRVPCCRIDQIGA